MIIVFSLFFTGLISAQDGEEQAPEKQTNAAAAANTISMDIKGMDIVDVIKMISTRSGMNIMVGKNVTGKVTLFIKNADIQDAFEIVLLSNDLAYEKKGGIINVLTQKEYELLHGERYQDKKQAKVVQLKYAKAQDLARTLTQIKTNIGKVVADENSNTLSLIDTPEKIIEMENFIKIADLPVQTKVFSLKYAQAEKLSPKLQAIITKSVGSLTVDERTNKIVITDYPNKLDEISKTIEAFDEKTPQVLIDAQIIEISPSDKFEMGVDWDFWLEKNLRLAASLPTAGAINKLSIGTAVAGLSPAGRNQYKAIIDLLRTIGDTKILSSPRIMVLNNQEAKIHVGTNDAFITSTVSQTASSPNVTSQSVNFVEVGIKLSVTPVINRDGFVIMKIRPEISSSKRTDITSGGQITQVPIVTTSEAETTIMLKDGVTIIIAGLKKEEKNKTVKSLPILGDIPLLGALFRNTSDEFTKSELVILLTPHIISGSISYTDFSEIKPKEGAVVKMVKGDIITEKILDISERQSLIEDSHSYYKLLADKVKILALFGRPKEEKGEVELKFTLSRYGKLIDEPRILKTNNPVLSKSAIKETSSFPPFPATLANNQETFRINLSTSNAK